jgi:glycerol-3-phosphate cytidylyltransferase-like family protein
MVLTKHYMESTVSTMELPKTLKPKINDELHPAMSPGQLAESVIKLDLLIDPNEGLVIPRLHDIELIESKIITHLIDLNQKLKSWTDNGGKVLYLPGSYDLTHIGHALYIKECIDTFLEFSSINRDQLKVVMMADSDELIAHVKSSKHITNGGTELVKRPVETNVDRIIGMASIPFVDLVGIIPSQWDYDHLLQPIELPITDLIEQAKNNTQMSADDKQELLIGLYTFEKYINNDLVNKKNIEALPVETWQLYITSLLMEDIVADSVYRLISISDTKYLDKVSFLMHALGIQILLIEDTQYGSTSVMIDKFQNDHQDQAWNAIRDYKMSFLDQSVYNKMRERVAKSINY